MAPNMRAVVWLTSWALVAACGEPSTTDDEPRCVPGETTACTLADGTAGQRACSPDFRFGDCAPSGDGGLGAMPDVPWLSAGVPFERTCPMGWPASTTSIGVVSCEPYDGRAACASDEAHFPGEPACTRLGTACPADGLPADLPVDRPVVYVLAGAVGGDGSAGAPYGSLTGFSLGSLRSSTVIAVGRGTYDAAVLLPAAVTVRGACVAETVLTSSEPHDTEGVLHLLRPGDSEVQNLTVADAERPGISVFELSTHLTLSDVVLRANRVLGILIDNTARVDATSIAIRDTRPRAADLAFGGALSADDAATAVVRRAIASGNRTYGVSAADPGTRVELEDVALVDTLHQELDGGLGRGLTAEGEATVTLERTLVERSREMAMFAAERADVMLTDSLVRDTLGRQRDMFLGRGLSAQSDAVVRIVRSVFERNRELGIYASDGATLTLAEVVVRNTVAEMGDERAGGRGLNVQFGATATVAGAVFDQNREVDVLVSEPGSFVSLEDVLVRDTLAGGLVSVWYGRAFDVQAGAGAEASRAVFEHGRGANVTILNTDTTATFMDVVIRDALVRDCGATECTPLGQGIVVDELAAVTMDGFQITRAAHCGVVVAPLGEVDLSNGEVSDCRIGACVVDGDYDFERLSNNVYYRDNGTNLETATLPTPEAARLPEPGG